MNWLMTDLTSKFWYSEMADECRAIFTEKLFNHRWELVELYHLIGKRILEESKNAKWSEIIKPLSGDLNIHERNLYYAVKFAEKFPEIDKLPDGKVASWSKVRKLLPAHPQDEKPELEISVIAEKLLKKHGEKFCKELVVELSEQIKIINEK